MPRRYQPVHKVDYYWGEEYHTAEMEESKYGEWIPLKVYTDEINRLNAVILKLKKQLNNQYGKVNNENP